MDYPITRTFNNAKEAESFADNFRRNQYWDEVKGIVEAIKEEAEPGDDIDEKVREYVDGHRFIIYTAYHSQILEYSDNNDYGLTNGLVDDSTRDVSNLLQSLAYWAMYQDVVDELDGWEPEDEDEEDDEEESEED